ncbi:MAG: stage III sporulation AC/AD family protein [Oscillospiraceae bacterium]|jgi:stage III sporulation protein AC|nr:stage III sporulation AC/AD family protein [Oscillospiraceae bacterium]
METIFKIFLLGLVVAIVNLLLDNVGASSYKFIVSLIGLITGLMLLVPELQTLFDTIRNLFDLW